MDTERYEVEPRSPRDAQYKPISVINWIGTLLLSILPGINLVLWIIWAASSKKVTRRNFSRAMLIVFFLLLAAVFILVLAFGQDMLDWARSTGAGQTLPDTPPAA